jgi:hypothetical protein
VAVELFADRLVVIPPGELPRVDGTLIGLTVPDDGVWYTVTLRRLTSQKGPGTVAVTTGSKVVLGTDTTFARYMGKNDPGNPTARGMLFRIDAADTGAGNEGTYEIDTVDSDTQITLIDPINGTDESGIEYRIAGEFLGTVPSDPDIHTRIRFNWVLQARTVGQKYGGASANRIIVADVMRDTGIRNSTFIVPRRHSQLFRRMDQQEVKRGYYPVMVSQANTRFDAESDWIADATNLRMGWRHLDGIVGQDVETVSAAWSDSRATILVVCGGAAGDIVSYKVAANDRGDVPQASRSNYLTVDNAGTAFDPFVLANPSGHGGSGATAFASHLLFYTKTGSIRMRKTLTGGNTWEAEATIWNAPLVDASHSLHHPTALLTVDNRIIVAATYDNNGTGGRSIRWIYSDDFGETWTTNSDAGVISVDETSPASAFAQRPSLSQDDNGVIFLAYERSVGGGDYVTSTAITIGLAKSIDPNGLSAANLVLANGAVEGVIDTAFGVAEFYPRKPSVWAAPNGTCLVFYSSCYEALGLVWCVMYCTVAGFSGKSAATIQDTVAMFRREISAGEVATFAWGGMPLQCPGSGVLYLVSREIDTGTRQAQYARVVPTPAPITRRSDLQLPWTTGNGNRT